MAHIKFEHINIEFPIYNASNRSLKKSLIQAATGGRIGNNEGGLVVVKALEDINLDIKDGERVALLGHNGAGKTTMLRLLSGVYAPTQGTASVSGEIGSLIDISLGIDAESTGRENVYIRASLLGMRKKWIEENMEAIIEFSGLGEFIDLPLRTYSSGMRLRLAFSVSTMIRPEIIIMDEWISVGDDNFKHKAEARMQELVQSSNILVIATHSKSLAMKVCSRAVWLEHGRIKEDGNVKEVADKYFS